MFIGLLSHFIIWLVLALYSDQVFPNEFGHKKHPLFFLGVLWKAKTYKKLDTDLELNEIS